jgi:GAF domain-containing protein
MGAALAYYLGFAPPRRLQRVIQQAEVARAYDLVVEKLNNAPLERALDDLGPTFARAVGGKVALVALGHPGSDRLRLHLDAIAGSYPGLAEDPLIDLSDRTDPLTEVWHEHAPVVFSTRERRSTQVQRIDDAVGGSRSALIAPLMASGEPVGLVIALLDRRTAFLDDDCEVLTMLAERAGAGIQNRRLFEAARQDAVNRQLLLELSEALADEVEAMKVAEQLAGRVADSPVSHSRLASRSSSMMCARIRTTSGYVPRYVRSLPCRCEAGARPSA